MSGMHFVAPLVQFFPTLGFGSWFLHEILGSAVWVGLAVIVLSLPLPALASRSLERLQKEKMAASDARVKAVKEALNVLRMVKQFGWQGEVKRQIEAQRAEELRWLFWRKIYSLLNTVVK
jgi:cytochrome bd-type quinol oxidase subunit 1